MALSYKENTLLILQHKEPEYMPAPWDMDIVFPSVVHETGEGYDGKPALDWFGQSWTFEPNIGGENPTPGVHLVTDITRWREQMKFPDLDKIDFAAGAAEDTADWDREHKLSRIVVGFGLWERLFSVMDFSECLMALLEEPEACEDFFSAVADFKIDLFQRLIHHYRPDQIVFHDDYGNAKGMFMSPDTWRSLIKPHLQRVIDSVTAQGVFYEHHCCGNFTPILEEIADMGAASFNHCHVSMEPWELKKKLGHKIAFFGGFDVHYFDAPTTSAEQVRVHVRETLDRMAPGGSFYPRIRSISDAKQTAIAEEIVHYGSTFYSRPRPDQTIPDSWFFL